MKIQKIKFQDKGLNFYLRDDADSSVIAEIFKWKEYKCSESIIKSTKEPILDIGAHIGIFSIYVKALNPNALVYAVEPEKDNFNLLAKNLKLNHFSDVRIFDVAIAGRTEKRNFIVEEENINHHLTVASDDNNILVNAYGLGDFLKKYNLSHVGILKMDIEGAEYEVFENLHDTDFEKIRNIILEYHNFDGEEHKKLETLLREKGFGVQIFPSRFEKNLGFLFARNKRKC